MVENIIQTALGQVAEGVWTGFTNILPNAIASLLVLIVGLIIGKIAGKIVNKLAKRAKIDDWLTEENHLNLKLSMMSDVVVRWVIYLVAIQQAASLMGIGAIQLFFNSVLMFLFGLVKGAVIIIIGYSLAIYLKDRVIVSRTTHSNLMGSIIFFLLIYLSIALALPSFGVENTELIGNILLVIMGSTGLGLAIAVGLGLKDVFADFGKQYMKKLKSRPKRRKY